MSEEETADTTQDVRANDDMKIFVSRIPSTFDETSLKRLLEESLGIGSVTDVALVYPKPDETNDDTTDEKHRGFAFVTLDSVEHRQEALTRSTIRGGPKVNSKKKHTLYLRPVVRDEGDKEEKSQVCFLWVNFRCPYGGGCKFSHEGEGGCLEKTDSKKKQKCFAFKKGKCKLGDECPYSHDLGDKTVQKADPPKERSTSEKDCINWKTKGKCRKGDDCPYRHDDEVQKAVMEKLDRKKRKREDGDESTKDRQPLSVRVFGLNYDTSEQDVREYFAHCGPIVEFTFPTFEDSGRSKGYCGILFQSPKAVSKAVELDGKELHGRWLSVQAGKMYLKQWEGQHQSRKTSDADEPNDKPNETPQIGEFGQKVKRRKQHGYTKSNE